MSPQAAKTIVLLTGGLLFAAIALRRDNISDPFKFAWGAGVITVFLSVLADIAPEIAGPFALLALIVVYFRNSDVINSALPNVNAQGATAAHKIAPNGNLFSAPTKGGTSQ